MDQNLGDKAAPSLAAAARLPRVGVDRSRAMGQVLVRGDPGGAAGGGRSGVVACVGRGRAGGDEEAGVDDEEPPKFSC